MNEADKILKKAERQCDFHGEGWISILWKGRGHEHSYPWPDISINLAILPEGDNVIYGMSLPATLMDDVKAKVRFEPAEGAMLMTPPAPREDVLMAIDEALKRFGAPTALSFQ